MIKLDATKMQKAIERAKQLRPRVVVVSVVERVYAVQSARSPFAYRVRFVKNDAGKFGECNCEAGLRGLMCYHIASAAAVNIAIHAMRQAAVAQ